MSENRPQIPIDEPCNWTAADLSSAPKPHYLLDSAMINEIETAARAALAEGRPHYEWRDTDFDLQVSRPMLAKAYADIEDGAGFAIVEGWPVDDHSYDMNVAAYGVIASHIGEIKVQNYEGDWVVDVVNADKPYSHTSRGYQSADLLPFHSDGADISGLLGLGEAAWGGETILVSAITLYNTIADERPDVLTILERGFYHHRRGQHPAGEHPLSPDRIPVFAFHNGLLHSCYNRNPIEWVRHEGMELMDREIEALDVIDAIVARPELQMSINIGVGEILFFNNFTALHSRTAFEDDANHKRHLVRLWLEDPNSKRLGETLLDLYVPGTSRYESEEDTRQ